MHNMAAEVAVSNHLTKRNGVWHYVRRVPEDLRASFPFARVQKSLRTSVERQARAAALDLDQVWDRRFRDARERTGLACDGDEPSVLSTDSWTWPDWEALAAWFEASCRGGLAGASGCHAGPVLAKDADPGRIPWRDDRIIREHIDREKLLKSLSSRSMANSAWPLCEAPSAGSASLFHGRTLISFASWPPATRPSSPISSSFGCGSRAREASAILIRMRWKVLGGRFEPCKKQGRPPTQARSWRMGRVASPRGPQTSGRARHSPTASTSGSPTARPRSRLFASIT